MSARTTTVLTCNRIGCVAQVKSTGNHVQARVDAKRLGWKVGVTSWNRRDQEDYCPEHKR
ncbi:hypothetical protein QDA09_gp07 [Microbacterium phage Tyrumbra]|uniref:Uncharacterized protein n=1 Tax=Microbacterium phage Tyrumbra TaxID=2596974 RepID=A0A516KPD4_9CAUD|nr:hypothetical protein QDA09_gp07 [Microbacterium phage Tyrumbra]QDP43545.1 hypothetical protein SEA_TYRUMBRA_7 [Microbacterium phage Tyrumbra]